MKNTTVFDCSLLQLPQNFSIKGKITSVNNQVEAPFEIQRVYYLYDVPGGESRGGHGHLELQQLIIAASGSFDLIVDDGKIKRTFQLNRPNSAVYMPPGLWRELANFSSGSICLVLASTLYNEADYIRNYQEFKNYKLK
jgi:hypothetical protein